MDKVNVILFPKKCPHCGQVMEQREWTGIRERGVMVQCRNDNCPHFTAVDPNTIGRYRYEYGRKCSRWQ